MSSVRLPRIHTRLPSLCHTSLSHGAVSVLLLGSLLFPGWLLTSMRAAPLCDCAFSLPLAPSLLATRFSLLAADRCALAVRLLLAGLLVHGCRGARVRGRRAFAQPPLDSLFSPASSVLALSARFSLVFLAFPPLALRSVVELGRRGALFSRFGACVTSSGVTLSQQICSFPRKFRSNSRQPRVRDVGPQLCHLAFKQPAHTACAETLVPANQLQRMARQAALTARALSRAAGQHRRASAQPGRHARHALRCTQHDATRHFACERGNHTVIGFETKGSRFERA